jgi:hypothetical protein
MLISPLPPNASETSKQTFSFRLFSCQFVQKAAEAQASALSVEKTVDGFAGTGLSGLDLTDHCSGCGLNKQDLVRGLQVVKVLNTIDAAHAFGQWAHSTERLIGGQFTCRFKRISACNRLRSI